MINIRSLDEHPLARRFYELSLELEKLPPSPAQTDLMQQLESMLLSAQDMLNGAVPLLDLNSPELDGAWKQYCDSVGSFDV